MKVSLAVLADYANMTGEGKLNIMGIFSRLLANEVPVTHPQMTLVIVFQSEPAERGQAKSIEVKLLDDDGKQLLGVNSTLNIPATAPLTAEFPQVAQLNNVRFERFGDYAFHILVNGDPKTQVSFRVESRPPATER